MCICISLYVKCAKTHKKRRFLGYKRVFKVLWGGNGYPRQIGKGRDFLGYVCIINTRACINTTQIHNRYVPAYSWIFCPPVLVSHALKPRVKRVKPPKSLQKYAIYNTPYTNTVYYASKNFVSLKDELYVM